jgi:CheY-like chemotaxis protein
MTTTPPDEPRILIVDNDQGVNAMLSAVLRQQGLCCESVLDGLEAQERLRQGGVSVLVTDLDMPRLDGLRLLSQLQEPAPAVVVISGYLDASAEARLGKMPAVRLVLRKPFDVLDFAERVGILARSQDPALRESAAGEP